MSTYWTDRFQLGTEPISVDAVTRPEYFELEREKIFRRVWLNVGRVEDVARPGDYFVKDIDLLRTSLLVVRDADGVVRSFHNLCRHRGNRVAQACSGSAKGFACNFHGWTYDLRGRLVHVPDEDQFPGLRKAEHGLFPVATEVWKGFIFVNVDPRPKESLPEFLGEMASGLEGYPFESMDRMVTYVADVKANWKVFMDGFLEGYHVPFVHKASLPQGFRNLDVSSLIRMVSASVHGRHSSISVPGNPMFEASPAEAEILKHDVRFSLGNAIPEERQPKGVNPDCLVYWTFDTPVFFPNFFIGASAGFYWTHNFWPIAVDRTLIESRFYAARPQTAADLVAHEFVKVLFRDAVREDFSRPEPLQQMLGSGVLKEIILSDQEFLLRHNYKVVEGYVRS